MASVSSGGYALDAELVHKAKIELGDCIALVRLVPLTDPQDDVGCALAYNVMHFGAALLQLAGGTK